MYKEKDRETIMAMKPIVERACLKLTVDACFHVPPTGKFEKVVKFFKDPTKSLDIVTWGICIRDLIYNGCGEDVYNKRYLELIAYIGDGYGITQIVGSGSLKECSKLLRSPSFIDKVQETMVQMLKDSNNL